MSSAQTTQVSNFPRFHFLGTPKTLVLFANRAFKLTDYFFCSFHQTSTSVLWIPVHAMKTLIVQTISVHTSAHANKDSLEMEQFVQACLE